MLAKKIGVLRLGYVNYPPVYYSRGDRRPSVLGLAWSVLVESAPPTYHSRYSTNPYDAHFLSKWRLWFYFILSLPSINPVVVGAFVAAIAL